jgi:hypothetical protein
MLRFPFFVSKAAACCLVEPLSAQQQKPLLF